MLQEKGNVRKQQQQRQQMIETEACKFSTDF